MRDSHGSMPQDVIEDNGSHVEPWNQSVIEDCDVGACCIMFEFDFFGASPGPPRFCGARSKGSVERTCQLLVERTHGIFWRIET